MQNFVLLICRTSIVYFHFHLLSGKVQDLQCVCEILLLLCCAVLINRRSVKFDAKLKARQIRILPRVHYRHNYKHCSETTITRQLLEP